ncbi:MAG: restriction endonuclease subunit S [Bacteroidota bacterium]
MSEHNGNNGLPKGWVRIPLKEICEKIAGDGTPSTKIKDYWTGKIPWITSADIHGIKNIRSRKKINQKAIDNSTTTLVPKGTIIVVTRVGLGKIGITDEPLCFSQDSQGLIFHKYIVDKKYALFFLSDAVQIFKYKNRGTTIKGVTKKQLAELPFNLPPLPEQHRIVAKIEELFTQLDKGIEQLKAVQQQLKTYRRVVLKHAFEGKLTADWRQAQKDVLPVSNTVKELQRQREENYEIKLATWKKDVQEWKKKGQTVISKPSKPKKPFNLDTKIKPIEELVDSNLIPNSWSISPLVFASGNEPNAIVDGPFGSSINVKEDYKDTGVPVVRMINIRPFNYRSENLRFIRNDKFQTLRRHNILPGDILIAKVGATIGDCCIYPQNQPEAMLSTTGSCRIRVDPHLLNSKYLEYYIFYHRNTLKNIASQTAQPFLNMKVVKSFPIAIAPISEQTQIVQAIETRLFECDYLEKTIAAALQKSEALRQSILKRAFEGKLVAQDANDEPAAVLLERIKKKNNEEKTQQKKKARQAQAAQRR